MVRKYTVGFHFVILGSCMIVDFLVQLNIIVALRRNTIMTGITDIHSHILFQVDDGSTVQQFAFLDLEQYFVN